MSPIERILARVQLVDQTDDRMSPCWVPNYAKRKDGYIDVSVGPRQAKRMLLAHVLMWEHCNGAKPAGLDLDHACHHPDHCRGGKACPHRACCNPDHLRLATRRQNAANGHAGTHLRERTHCPHGHPLDGMIKVGKQAGRRYCPTCKTIARRKKLMAKSGRDYILPMPGERTHCPRGHEYDGVSSNGNGKAKRYCKTCNNDRHRAKRLAASAAA